jgi:asparagine synthase (glutamine-hydrolysing)
MSAQGGALFFEADCVPGRLLNTLDLELEPRGPDGGHIVRVGRAGMVYRAFHTREESRREIQPLVTPFGHMLTWDGRLDNRRELERVLGACLTEECTQTEVVLASYRKWGAEFLTHLVGDYALCLWDQELSTVYLARDPFGIRPLFYHATGTLAIWASEIGAVVSAVDACAELDDDYIAAYLTGTEDWARTPYKGVFSVPPGSVVMVKNGDIQVRRFWSADPKNEIRYQKDSDYAEHFSELFRESVACRLQVEGPVMAELSGGLDSSSIVCMASHLIKGGDVEASSLETVSYVYDDSRTADESYFIGIVEEHVGKAGHHLWDQRIFDPTPEELPTYIPTPLALFAGTFTQLADTMHEARTRVLLCGGAGDHVLMHDEQTTPQFADLFLQGNLVELVRLLRAWSATGNATYLELMWNGLVWPLLPLKVRAHWTPKGLEAPEWINRQFAAATGFGERLIGRMDCGGFHTPSSQRQYSLILDAISLVCPCYYRERACIEVTYPYLHRPLVEFTLAIPVNQKQRPGETRSVQRRAMQGLLPERIRLRTTKRGPDEALTRALIRQWSRVEELLTDARVCQRGYADAPGFKQALRRVRHGQSDQLQPLGRLLALELWLRTQERFGQRSRLRSFSPSSSQEHSYAKSTSSYRT